MGIAQPVETLRQFASFAGLEWNAAIETRAEAAVEAAALRKKSMGGKVVYQLGAFGLTEAGIQERLDNCETESFESSAIREPDMEIRELREQVEGTICAMSSNVTDINLTNLTNRTNAARPLRLCRFELVICIACSDSYVSNASRRN